MGMAHSSGFLARSIVGACIAALAAGAFAQEFPVRPIRIIVPSAAGGGTDSTTRIFAPKMDEFLKQRVVVENRAGAASIIGTDIVAKSPPDGYTLLTGISTITINPHVHKKLPYDTFKDIVPVSQFVELPNMLVGHPSIPAHDLKAMMAFVRTRPNQLQYASAGRGSNLHLCMELFLSMTGLKMVHVPYRGSGQAMADLVAGYVPFMITNMITGTQQIRAGKLRAFGVTSAKRSPAEPNIPTIAEQGVPGYAAVQWYGLMAPGGTPKAVIDKLYQSVAYALKDSQVQKRFAASGAVPIGNTPEQFAAVMKSDTEKWGKVVKAAGLSPE